MNFRAENYSTTHDFVSTVSLSRIFIDFNDTQICVEKAIAAKNERLMIPRDEIQMK